MDAGSLKAFVSERAKAARQEPSPMENGTDPSPGFHTAAHKDYPEAVPGSDNVRASWTIYQPEYKDLPGFMSKRALEEHLKLYANYLSRAKLAEGASASERWAQSETDNVAGAVLHELFFQGLTVLPSAPALAIQGALINRWNSLDVWWSEMTQAGMVAHGWAITAVCERDPADLQIFSTYSHDHGLPPGYIPICVADCYEHAYWMDYGSDRAKYLNEMYRFLNWEALEERFTHATR